MQPLRNGDGRGDGCPKVKQSGVTPEKEGGREKKEQAQSLARVKEYTDAKNKRGDRYV